MKSSIKGYVIINHVNTGLYQTLQNALYCELPQ